MRILLVTDGLFPFVMGGMQKHSYYLVKYLAERGVEVHVVHCADEPVAGRERELLDWPKQWSGRASFQQVPFPPSDGWPGHYIRGNKRYSRAVYDLLKDRLAGFDLIYCQGFTAWAFIQGRQRGEVKVPVVVNLHGYEMYQSAPFLRLELEKRMLRPAARRISLGADAVFSFGGRLTGILQRMGVEKERILECPIGIEESWLVEEPASVGKEPRSFIFVGRDERRKGVVELHEAIRLLKVSTDVPFVVHFVGPLRDGMKIQEGHVVYHGMVRDEGRVKELFRAAEVLLCPSYSEGMPTVIMEAMASGLAVIATDVGAVSQQVERNGWLLPGPEPVAVAQAMRAAMDLPSEDLLSMKRRSLEKVREQFTWKYVIGRKLELLKTVRLRVW